MAGMRWAKNPRTVPLRLMLIRSLRAAGPVNMLRAVPPHDSDEPIDGNECAGGAPFFVLQVLTEATFSHYGNPYAGQAEMGREEAQNQPG